MRFVLMAFDGEREDVTVEGSLDAFRTELVRAGVLLAAEGLEPSERGARVEYDGEERILSRPGPGACDRIWMLDTAGEEEAVEWARRLPLSSGAVEVRRVTGDER